MFFPISQTLYDTMVLIISQMFWVTQWSNLLPRHCELHNGLIYFRDIVICAMVSGIIPPPHQYHFIWYQKPITIYQFQNRNMRFLKDKLIHHLQKLKFLYIHQSFLLKPSLLKVRDPGQVWTILELLKTSFPYISTRTIFYAMECENIGYKSCMGGTCNWMVWHRLCLVDGFSKATDIS